MTARKPAKHHPDPPVPTGEGGLFTSKDLFGDVVDAPLARSTTRPEKPGPVKVRVIDGPQEKPVASPGRGGVELPPEMAALLDAFDEPGTKKAAESATPEDQPSAADVDRLLDAFSGAAEDAIRAQASSRPDARARPLSASGLRLEALPPTPAPARASVDPDWDSLLETEPPPETALSGPDEPVSAFDDVVDTLLSDLGEQPASAEFDEDLDSALRDLAPLPVSDTEKPGVRPRGSWRDDRYGPYQLLDRVAVGGMAEVFKARYEGVEGFEKIVAVKRILPHLSDNPEFVEMFVAEAKMVAGLSHANIVQIHDLGRLESSYFIAMEYVHGRDLRSILRRTREKGMKLPLDLSLLIVREVCSALDYAHRKRDERGRPMRIVHRDVSPQNILISFEGDVKLADFGIAKAATKASSTEGGALRGKLMYMSPEQAWGQPMDGRSDIFSLGLVLYEMVTDLRPFLSTSEMSILEMVRACRIRPPREGNPRLPEALDRAILKALAKDVEDRYQDAGEMGRALDRVFIDRHLPASADLAHFLSVLYDLDEREEAIPDDLFPTHGRRREIHLEEDHPPVSPESPPARGDDDLLSELGLD